jgi:hypothetical protein
VDCAVGLTKKARLLALLEKTMAQAAAAFEQTKEKQRHFVRSEYAANSRDRPRSVIAKAEQTAEGQWSAFLRRNLLQALGFPEVVPHLRDLLIPMIGPRHRTKGQRYSVPRMVPRTSSANSATSAAVNTSSDKSSSSASGVRSMA